ncbi:MAG: serine/threonine-protein kinase [Bryobacteraceae bacterium]|jgi:serine/threonine-protein kinase
MDRIGRYKIVGELGRGAMGVVYHAVDPNIGRPVAIKTIRLGGKPEEQERMRERLFREARSAGLLSHPGIVTIYDVERQGDLAYIAMEYVDGPTLDHLMTPEAALPPERIFSVLAQTAAALDYAYQKGIVHRDIKPANIMIAADGTVKITDFGIAKITTSEQFTMTGAIVGTPHYMSPEQVQGQAVDGRSDQFSLAVMAFEMLTGEKPFTGEQITTVAYKIVAEEPLAPNRLNPTLAAPIESALRKGLAKKPDARFRTCQEFVESLEKACAASRGWKPMPRGGGASEPTAAMTAGPVKPAMKVPPARLPRARDVTETAERRTRRRTSFLAFLLSFLVVAGLLALIGWQADPTLPQKAQGLAQRIQTALGLGSAAPEPPPAAAETSAMPPAAPPSTVLAQPGPAATQEEAKPSPMPPPTPAPVEAPKSESAQPEPGGAGPAGRASGRLFDLPAARKPAGAGGAHPVAVVSSPPGATAALDGRTDAVCVTPCSLAATPGRHAIVITLPGYQSERRDVVVGSGAAELPAVVLRALSGSLMLTTVPAGATILVDGRKLAETTPTSISLPPGDHTVTVEKDGRQAVSPVEIRTGAISYLRVVLNQ